MTEVVSIDDTTKAVAGAKRGASVKKKPVQEAAAEPDDEDATKKRGRKPKGGKIIIQTIAPMPPAPVNIVKSNVVLHLKCSLKDLHTFTAIVNPDIMEQFFPQRSSTTRLGIDITAATAAAAAAATAEQTPTLVSMAAEATAISINDKILEYMVPTMMDPMPPNWFVDDAAAAAAPTTTPINMSDINRKLKALETQLHHNNLSKQSACFWCSCEFKTCPVYIPKYVLKNTYHVYGCFCSPECAAAHVMGDHLDTSTKFERYALLNHLYCRIFGYTKNITPAPNPHYLLEKYYGNLTIDEYRALFKSNKQIFVIDKPLTKIMPELHQDTADVLLSNKLLSKDVSALGGSVPPASVRDPHSAKRGSLKALFSQGATAAAKNAGTTPL